MGPSKELDSGKGGSLDEYREGSVVSIFLQNHDESEVDDETICRCVVFHDAHGRTYASSSRTRCTADPADIIQENIAQLRTR